MYERARTDGPDPERIASPLRDGEAHDPVRAADDGLTRALRHRGLIGAGAVFGLVAALGFATLALPRYTASTQIIIDPTDLRVVDNSLRAPSAFSDQQIAQVEDEVRVLTSSTVLNRVVATEHLDADDEFNGSRPTLTARLGARARGLLGLPPAAEPAPVPAEAAMRALAKAVTAKREERTFVVDVAVAAREPAKAARLADAVVAAFLDVSQDARNDAARRADASLKDRLGDLRQELETAEQRVVDFKTRNALVAAVGQSVAEQQLVAASTRLGDARTQLADAQARYGQVLQAERSGDAGAMPDALQSPTVTSLRAQLADVLRREGNLAATLGARHPVMAEMHAQDASIRALVREELNRVGAAAKGNLDRAVAAQTAAQAAYASSESRVTAKNALSVRLAELEREVQSDKTVYEAFLTRTRELGQQAQIDVANISVISPAQVPDTRTWPPKPLYLLGAGLLAGLALGVGAALALEHVSGGHGATPEELAPDRRYPSRA